MQEEIDTHIGVIVPVLIVVFVAIIVVVLMWLKMLNELNFQGIQRICKSYVIYPKLKN